MRSRWASVAGSAAALLAFAAVPARAPALDLTCSLALVKVDPNVLNVAYPDAAAEYFGVSYTGVPGTQLEIDGVYPHARYISFTAYDPALRPLAGLNDLHIAPDAGSADPFVAGAARNTAAASRHYTVYVNFGPKPSNPAPNTIYTGTGQNGTPNLSGTILYRIYIPDQGTDFTGGVGLPNVTLEPSGTHAVPGTSSLCTGTSAPPLPVGANSVLATTNGVPQLETHGFTGLNPPLWSKFVNAAYSVVSNVIYSPAGKIVAPLDGPLLSGAATAGGSGGFLSNLDNNYVSATINRGYGQVLVSRMRVASFANTRRGETPMPGAQLRYWSMCENDPFTERFVACGTDDQSTQRPSGYATYVVSTPAQRPRNATAACGVNWLPWGPDQAGLLILRNMLPDPAFKEAVQNATVGKEAQTMGAYLPASRYYSKEGFEALGCGGAAAAVPVAGSGARCPRATGRLHGTRLGLLRLGLTRARARRDYAYSTRGKRYKDFFCLTPQGIRVGYASPRLLRGLGARERARFRGRVVWISTSNQRYSLHGVRPGMRLRAAARRVHLGAGLHIGLNWWYFVPNGASTGVLKVRHGAVQEIGIAVKSLTQGRRAQFRVMTSFRG